VSDAGVDNEAASVSENAGAGNHARADMGESRQHAESLRRCADENFVRDRDSLCVVRSPSAVRNPRPASGDPSMSNTCSLSRSCRADRALQVAHADLITWVPRRTSPPHPT